MLGIQLLNFIGFSLQASRALLRLCVQRGNIPTIMDAGQRQSHNDAHLSALRHCDSAIAGTPTMHFAKCPDHGHTIIERVFSSWFITPTKTPTAVIAS